MCSISQIRTVEHGTGMFQRCWLHSFTMNAYSATSLVDIYSIDEARQNWFM